MRKKKKMMTMKKKSVFKLLNSKQQTLWLRTLMKMRKSPMAGKMLKMISNLLSHLHKLKLVPARTKFQWQVLKMKITQNKTKIKKIDSILIFYLKDIG